MFSMRSPLWTPLLLIALVLGLAAAPILSDIGSGARTAAQDLDTPEPEPTAGTVRVTAQGVVAVEPDTASVRIGVNVMRPTLEDAQAEATEQMAAIIDAVVAEGVAADDLRTTTFSVQVLQERDRDGNVAGIRGYEVSNQVTVTVRDLDTLGTVLDAAVDAGANNIRGINLHVEDTSAAASQARAAAVQEARQKADELATAAGLQVTRVVTITETAAPAPQPFSIDAIPRTAVAETSVPVPIQPGTIELKVDVSITYEIE